MKTWVIVGLLILLPIGLFLIAGSLWLVEHAQLLTGVLVWVTSWLAAGLLIRRGIRRDTPLEKQFEHDQDRHRQALKLIAEHERKLQDYSPAQLRDASICEKVIVDLAQQLVTLYHPSAEGALDPLTPKELLMAAERLVDTADGWLTYLAPGGQNLTIRQWRQLGHAPSRLLGLGMLAAERSSFAHGNQFLSRPSGPAIMLARERAVAMAASSVNRFVLRQLGYLLVDLYSGRMRLTLRRRPHTTDQPSRAQRNTLAQDELTIAVLGPRNAGKSSLIWSLIGTDRASVDRLPTRPHVQRHRVQLDQPLARLVLLEANLTQDFSDDDLICISDSTDLIVFVVNGSELRDEAVRMLNRVSTAADRLPVICVATHVDQATEFLAGGEWPESPSATEEALWRGLTRWQARADRYVSGVLPVGKTSDDGACVGLFEWVVPAIIAELTEQQNSILHRALQNIDSVLLKS